MEEDEVICKSNDDQLYGWDTPGHKCCIRKTSGGGIMVAGLRCMHFGFVSLSDGEWSEMEEKLQRTISKCNKDTEQILNTTCCCLTAWVDLPRWYHAGESHSPMALLSE